MTVPTCQHRGCDAPATVAVQTQRPTRANLWTKVWWEESEAPKKAERLCGDHCALLLAELAKVLA